MGAVSAGLGIRTVAFCQRHAPRLTDASANLFAKVAKPLVKEFTWRSGYNKGAARELAGIYNYLNCYAGHPTQPAAGITDEQRIFCNTVKELLKHTNIAEIKGVWPVFKRIQLDAEAGYFKLLCKGSDADFDRKSRLIIASYLHGYLRQINGLNILDHGTSPMIVRNIRADQNGNIKYLSVKFEGEISDIMGKFGSAQADPACFKILSEFPYPCYSSDQR